MKSFESYRLTHTHRQTDRDTESTDIIGPKPRRFAGDQKSVLSQRPLQGCICQIFTGGSEFRLATSDYSGNGGCQIGTVE